MIPHWLAIVFLFALGACIGSFLNVVVWRLPRNKSLLWPPSACPKCGHRLAMNDNIPVFGWIMLGGKCRYCREKVSARYPLVEAITGLLFVFYYCAFFIWHLGPAVVSFDAFGIAEFTPLRDIVQDWAIFGLILLLISSLLAVSLIDAELFIIPIEIPWVVMIIAFVVHALIAAPSQPGALLTSAPVAALAMASAIGVVLSLILLKLKVIPRSFPEGDPLLDFERAAIEKELKERNAPAEEFAQLPPAATKGQIRKEMAREALFLVLPVVLGITGLLLYYRNSAAHAWWSGLIRDQVWLSGLCGSMMGAMVAGALIWFTRILATLTLGRVAMGQGDTHLMLAIGSVLGAGPSLVVFFAAPFCGLAVGIYGWLTKGRRELPYGPYLSLAAAVVVLIYRDVEAHFQPHIEVLSGMIGQLLLGY